MGDDLEAEREGVESAERSDEASSRAGYDPNEQRARVRERVRQFEVKVEELWTGPAPMPEGSRHNSTLDSLMKHKSLNAFRFRWFANATAFPVMATIVAMTFLYGLGADIFGLNVLDAPLVADNFDLFLILATIALTVLGVSIYVGLRNKLSQECRDYESAIGKLAPRIDVLITNQLNEESSVVSENAAKIRAVVSRQEDMNQVSEGVKDTMRSWRRLERLPYYLRHAWDMYYVDVTDHRELPRLRNPRFFKFVLPFILIALVSVWALIDVAAVLLPVGIDPLVMLLGLPVSQLTLIFLLTTFYVLFFFYRRHTRGELFRSKLATCVVMALFLVMMAFEVGSGGQAGPRALHLVSCVALLIIAAVFTGLAFALMADRGFKRTARIAPVFIVDALKTHKKADVMAQFKFRDVAEYLRLLEGKRNPDPVWGGWTPEYEAEKRAELYAEGHDEYETEVRVAVDPVIYVGERGNRRIQVCQFDPTPAFLNAIPELRTAGG